MSVQEGGNRINFGRTSRSKVPQFEKEYQYYKVKEEQREGHVKQGIINQLKGCTFNPSIKNPRHRRAFTSFLQEQRDHSLRRQEELEDIATESVKKEKDKLQVAPTISEVSATNIKLIEFTGHHKEVKRMFGEEGVFKTLREHPKQH